MVSFFSRFRTSFWFSTSWALLSRVSSLSTESPATIATRARFLSSSATTFLATVAILSSDPQESSAATMGTKTNKFNKNPRYIDKELEMKYGEGPGKDIKTV
jgi:hypothetical protein